MSDIVLHVDATMFDAASGGYVPGIVRAGESGYTPTNWNYGADLGHAKRTVDEANARMGYTPDQVAVIVAGAMASVR